MANTLIRKVTLTGTVNKFVTGTGNDTLVGNNNGDVLDSGPGNDRFAAAQATMCSSEGLAPTG